MNPADNPLDPQEIDHRLTDLEVKAAYADDLLDHLNVQVARQQEQIELLLLEVRRLRDEVRQAASASPRRPEDDLPPHY
jgi:SlyX protein